MGILKRSLHRVKVSLSSGDPMEKTNQFMRDGVFTKEGDLFNCVEDDGGLEDGSVKRVNSM